MSKESIALSSPIYSMERFHCPSFLERETRKSPQIVCCGGGGSGKTGIHNFIIIGGIKRDATGALHLKKLANFDTDTNLLHQIKSASNGRFLFGSMLNKTIIYRVKKGDEEEPIKLEHVLTQVTDESPKGYQHALAVKKDDTTILTGGNNGVLSFWKYRLTEDKTPDLHLINMISLFDHNISCITLNPTETHAIVGSGKGEIAIVDLVNVGIVQRIKPTLPRLKIQSLHFISHFVFVAIVNEGRDHTHVYHYSTESNNSEEAKWNRDWVYRISHRSICASLFEEKNKLFVFGTNAGEIGIYEYPSLSLFKQFMPICDMPITSVTYLPPNKSMLYLQDKLQNEKEYDKTVNQQIVDQGWFAASSVDYLISTVKIEKSDVVMIGRIVYVLFLIFIIWLGLRMIMKAVYCVC